MLSHDVETYFEDGRWHNWTRADGVLPDAHDTKEAAVEAGRAEARRRGADHLVRDEHALVEQVASYTA